MITVIVCIQNKTNSENRHLVFLIFKKEQENDGVGFLFFLEYQEYKVSIFGICFILYFLKLSACRGFYCMYTTVGHWCAEKAPFNMHAR